MTLQSTVTTGRYQDRIAALRARKIAQTLAKSQRNGSQDEDDYGCVLPPADFKWRPPVQDENGLYFGARAWGANFRSLMEHHPVYIDANDALAGRWMFMLSRMRAAHCKQAPFPADYRHLQAEQERYNIVSGIGMDAHFAPDYRIGLKLGWGGLKRKVEKSLSQFAGDAEAGDLLAAELDAIAGIQNWILRTAAAARDAADVETDVDRKLNLDAIATMNEYLADGPPRTLREACQWIAWFNMVSRTYNRDGAGGQLDELLRPYFENDLRAGNIDDEDATFFIACLLLNDPHYYQIGGPGGDGRDLTSPISFLILEAAHWLKISCNVTVRVHDGLDEQLYNRALDILLADRLGYPRFSGDKALVAGFIKNGYSAELARERIAVGCNWMCLPGREYTMNDVVKINIAKVFEVALQECFALRQFSTAALADLFKNHLQKAVCCTAEGIDFHLDHQYLNEPELLLNLLCQGPIEKGRDASHGGVEFYNMCIDGAGLATVADSFAAIEQRIERENQLDWPALQSAIDSNFAGAEGARIRHLLSSVPKYGHGRSPADQWAQRLTTIFTQSVKAHPTPGGRNLMPGWFSWADTLRFGRAVGATPNGRLAGQPISHGANPHAGFRQDGALTAIIKAVAGVQPGYGNTAPLQLEVDPNGADLETWKKVMGKLIRTHFDLGGTLININVINADQILAAHKNPDLYPDLVVRVTGFSAYFASLSQEFRQLVVDRVIRDSGGVASAR